MDREGFRNWLEIKLENNSRKYRNDMLCRANRVEKAFQEIDNSFSYENEFKRDGGKELLKKLGCKGRELNETGIKLPLNTTSMFSIKSSAMWYFKYLSETEAK